MRPVVLALSLVALLTSAHANLLENGHFRDVDEATGLPVAWDADVHVKDGAVGSVSADDGAVKIANQSPKPAWVRASQEPIPAQADTPYRFSCRLRGDATCAVLLYEFLRGKPYVTHRVVEDTIPGDDWVTRSGTIRTSPDASYFKLSLLTTKPGTAWFTDVELRNLDEQPEALVPRWPDSALLKPFFLLDGGAAESAQPTSARLSYDDDALRVRFVCQDDQIAKMKTTQTADGMGVFADDCVELFLRPKNGGDTYYQVGVNANGARGFVRKTAGQTILYRSWFDLGRRAGAGPWQPDISVKAAVEDDRWTADVTIPWSALGTSPAPGMVLTANFTRRRNLNGEENSCWALMEGATFHDPTQWGRLILAANPEKPTGCIVPPEPPEPVPVVPDPAEGEPFFKIRAFHTQAPTLSTVTEYRRLVRTLAKLKYNMLMIEVNEKLGYERHPALRHGEALSKEHMRDLVDYCRGLGFEVVPQVQTWGHFNYVLNHEQYADLREEQTKQERWGYWNYCPSNPATYKLVFDLFDEVIEVFQPKYFHIGHDEVTFRHIGVCDRCKGTPGGELFAADVLKLHKHLRDKGLTMMMWGDQLLVEHNGKAPDNTADALPQIPRDVVMCDWHYGATADFPSCRFFKEQGFPVIACGWFNPANIANFASTAADARCEGYCMTTWWGVQNLARTNRTAAAIALSAQYAWAPKRFVLEEIPWNPVTAFRRHHFPAPPEGTYRALDLSAQAATPLADTDVAAVPRGKLCANGVPFVIGDEAIVLSEVRPKAWQIPVGGKVSSLHFLHCTSRPPTEVDHLYDRQSMLPGRVGRYVVTYADGTQHTMRLRFRREIDQWNSKYGAGEIAWQGTRGDGAMVTVCAVEWENPHPEKPVAALDAVRDTDMVDVLLLAVTARE